MQILPDALSSKNVKNYLGLALVGTALAAGVPEAKAQGTVITMHEVLSGHSGFNDSNMYQGVNLIDGVTTLTFTLSFTNAPSSLLPAAANELPGSASYILSDGVNSFSRNSYAANQNIQSNPHSNVNLGGTTSAFNWGFSIAGGTDLYPSFQTLQSADNFYGSLTTGLGSMSLLPATIPEPSTLSLTNVALAAGNFQFSFTSATGRTHAVKYTTNLLSGSWQNLTNIDGDGTLKTVQVPATNDPCFFRVLTQ